MVTDSKLNLGEITIPAASNVDTDILDFQAAGVAFGKGRLYFNALVSVVGAGGTSAQVKLMDSANGSAFVDVLLSRDTPLAEITAGKILLSVSLPSTIRRYIKANVIGAGAFSGGKIKIFLTSEPLAA